MAKNIVADEVYMTHLSKRFTTLATEVNGVRPDFENIKNSLNEQYEGEAKSAMTETFNVLTEHLEMLERCYEVNSKCVDYVLATLQEQDAKLAAAMTT